MRIVFLFWKKKFKHFLFVIMGAFNWRIRKEGWCISVSSWITRSQRLVVLGKGLKQFWAWGWLFSTKAQGCACRMCLSVTFCTVVSGQNTDRFSAHRPPGLSELVQRALPTLSRQLTSQQTFPHLPQGPVKAVFLDLHPLWRTTFYQTEV